MPHPELLSETLENLATLRTNLRSCAEPSGEEAVTSAVISNFVGAWSPDQLLRKVGGHGVAAVFDGAGPGPTVLIRAELDALATADGPAHLCGHDAHMAMVAGLAPVLRAAPPARGRVVLLFQPAEETGEGAQRVLEAPEFQDLRPDFAVALHGVPGYEAGTVLHRPGVFSCASVGMRVELRGEASHAAEPEAARSPMPALARLLSEFSQAPLSDRDAAGFLTVTHARLGSPSFGITPGFATLFATIRAPGRLELEALCRDAAERVEAVSRGAGLDVVLRWHDAFPSTESADDLVSTLAQVCADRQMPAVLLPLPFRWSEDFGHFAGSCQTLYFGLGAGISSPKLHQPSYEFPHAAISAGIRAFEGLYTELLAR